MSLHDEPPPSSAALGAVADKLRAVTEAARPEPATPESLRERAAALVEILGELRHVVGVIGADVERAASEAVATGRMLDADDGLPVDEYIYRARALLAKTAAGLDNLAGLTNEALPALAHLRLTNPGS